MKKRSFSRVLFKASGSSEKGFGHIRRSFALASEMSGEIGCKNVFFACNIPRHKVRRILKGCGRFIMSKNDSKITRFIRENNIGLVVLDEPVPNKNFVKAVKKSEASGIVALDYFDYKNTRPDKIINLFDHNRKSADRKKDLSGAYYEGLEYSIVRRDFFPFIKSAKKINPEALNILISFGGADPGGNTLKALDILEKAEFKGRADVVIGPLFKRKEGIRKAIEKRRYRCLLHKNLKGIEKLMFNADLGIVGGGTTMMEMCSVGTPVVVIPQNKREMAFALIFENKKAVKVLKKSENAKALVGNIIKNKSVRKTLSKNAKRVIDGKGIKRITDILLKG